MQSSGAGEPSRGDGCDDAGRAAATHAALLCALERMTAQEEATAAARRAALTAAAYDTETEGSSPCGGLGNASPWQLLSRDASADDLLADVADWAQRARVAAQVTPRAAAATQQHRTENRKQSPWLTVQHAPRSRWRRPSWRRGGCRASSSRKSPRASRAALRR